MTKDTVISYPEIQQFHSFRLPKLRVCRFDSRNRGFFRHAAIDMVRSYPKEVSSAVEAFRGKLFFDESVRNGEISEKPLEEFCFRSWSLWENGTKIRLCTTRYFLLW